MSLFCHQFGPLSIYLLSIHLFVYLPIAGLFYLFGSSHSNAKAGPLLFVIFFLLSSNTNRRDHHHWSKHSPTKRNVFMLPFSLKNASMAKLEFFYFHEKLWITIEKLFNVFYFVAKLKRNFRRLPRDNVCCCYEISTTSKHRKFSNLL